MNPARVLLLLAIAVLAAACASPRTISPGEARDLFGEFRVRSGTLWSRSGWRNVEVWTIDGPQLQQLRFYREMDDGKTLFEMPRQPVLASPDRDRYRPRYREGMSPHEVAEMVTATLAQFGAVKTRASQLRPADFGGRDGFRFELHFVTPSGLEYAGLALGRINERQGLHLILYLGTRDHYFPSQLEEVEQILASIAWL